MNYNHPELRERLASEYVLGTLHGLARKRFQMLMRYDVGLRALVSEWEQRLAPVNDKLTPITPPKRVWKKIEQRLGFVEESGLTRFWNHLGIWRSLASLGSVLSIILAVYLVLFIKPVITVNQYVAVITNEQQQASWMITLDNVHPKAEVRVLNAQALPAGKDFELWMLPEKQQPVSLGLLSASQNRTLTLSSHLALEVLKAKGLAVSLEPSGGSMTGLPTGPVLYQGKVQPI